MQHEVFVLHNNCHPEALNGESVQKIADVQDLKSSKRIK